MEIDSTCHLSLKSSPTTPTAQGMVRTRDEKESHSQSCAGNPLLPTHLRGGFSACLHQRACFTETQAWIPQVSWYGCFCNCLESSFYGLMLLPQQRHILGTEEATVPLQTELCRGHHGAPVSSRARPDGTRALTEDCRAGYGVLHPSFLGAHYWSFWAHSSDQALDNRILGGKRATEELLGCQHKRAPLRKPRG